MLSVSTPATRADLDALPPGQRGEIIDGVLYTSPRPRLRHATVIKRVSSKLDAPYEQGIGGPGGWIIVPEPGIELPRSPELVPDIAGWRLSLDSELDPDARITTVPNWVCEVLSPTNRRYDVSVKKPYYAAIGVEWLWIVDLAARELTAYRLGPGGLWLELRTYADGDRVAIEPFDAIDIDVGSLWTVGPLVERPIEPSR